MPSPFKFCLRLIAAATLGLGLVRLATVPLRATLVAPPAFDQLVGQSEYIVRAVVKSVTAEWQQSGASRHIITKVEFELREVIAGTPPSPLVLTMLGGKIGEDELVVDGAPSFRVGDEDVLFVRGSAKKLFPLVAMMHGQYPVVRDAQTGAAYVARSNGMPLRSEQEVSQPLSKAGLREAQGAAGTALTPEEFANRIRAARAAAPAARPH